MSCLNWLVFAHEKSCEARSHWKRSRVKIRSILFAHRTHIIIKLLSWRWWWRSITRHTHSHRKQLRVILHNRIETSFLKWKLIAFHPSGSLILMNIFAYRRISWTMFSVLRSTCLRLSRVCRYTHCGCSCTLRGVRVTEVEKLGMVKR